MALVLADRVKETSTTTGTGTFTLAGAVTGYQTFSAAIGNTNTCYYTIASQTLNEWEVGIGTVGAGTLARTTVLSSSNASSVVTFSAGTKDVFVTYPAERSMYVDGTTITPATAATLPVVSGGTGLSSVTANQIPYGNGTGALQTSANLTYNSTDLTLLSGDIYATNPTSAPSASFSAGKFLYSVGQIWNSGLGTKSMTGGFQVTSYQTNTNPTVSKLSFVVGTDNAAATEKMYVTSTGLFNINGGATFAGTTLNDTFNAVYVQNNAAATAGAAQASNKLFLQGRSWNAAAGNILTNGYLQAVTITNNANPTVESLNFAPASGSATAATQYFAMTSQGRFGVGTTTPTQTLDVTNTAGARQFTVASIASSVNYLQITGATTTNDPTITAQGSDTNIDVQIVPKGTGGLRFAGPLLPNNLAGTSGQVLTSAGAGAVPTWTTPAGSNITAQGLYENNATISANYTIGTGNNAVSAGPITINSGVVVTVPSGSTWSVV